MLSFCPECSQTLDQEPIVGQMLICRHCGKELGIVPAAPRAAVVDGTQEAIQQGQAARCPVCQQAVEIRASATARTLAPHLVKTGPRKVCPGSGKPISPAAVAPAQPAPAQPAPARPGAPKPAPAGKDLSAYMTREAIRVLCCPKDGPPTIEELTLEYLDKTDRVRLQIDALRDLLGTSFRMQEYPLALHQPHLATWGHAARCVVAKKHPQGGYQTLTDADLARVLADLQQSRSAFF